jgi:hypothetical protein
MNRGRSKSWKSVHKAGLWGKRLGKLRKVSFVKVAASLDFRNWYFPILTIDRLTAECRPLLLSVLLTKASLFAKEFCVDLNASKLSGLLFTSSVYRYIFLLSSWRCLARKFYPRLELSLYRYSRLLCHITTLTLFFKWFVTTFVHLL